MSYLLSKIERIIYIDTIYAKPPRYGSKKWRQCIIRSYKNPTYDAELFREVKQLLDQYNKDLAIESKKNGEFLWGSRIKTRNSKNSKK